MNMDAAFELAKQVFDDAGKFGKIEHISQPEVGTWYASEKLDGANAGILWSPQDEVVILHSRRNPVALIEIGSDRVHTFNEFRGFVSFFTKAAEENFDSYADFVDSQPFGWRRVFGEWLVPHTVRYPAEAYNKFYVFPAQSLNLPGVIFLLEEKVEDPDNEKLLKLYEKLKEQIKELYGDNAYEPEGLVIRRKNSFDRLKWVASRFREKAAKAWGANKKAIENPEALMASILPGRSLVKVWERVEDQVGLIPSKKELPMLLGFTLQEFAEEWFWRAAKKAGWPTISTAKLKRELHDYAREAFLTRIETGEWPTWVEHRVKGGK